MDSFKPVDLTVGRWGVFRCSRAYSSDRFTAKRLEKVTAKQIVARGYSLGTYPTAACVATFATEQEAGRLCQSLDGIAGEMVRRQREARVACEAAQAATIAIAKANA